jgi:aminoglycoside/choline kinase family phosphotransferase
MESQLKQLFTKWSGERAQQVEKMPLHGSNRKYFRIFGKNKTAIGVHNLDKKENIAFLSFSKHFKNMGLNVPKIYNQELNHHIYLQEDLGDETLFTFLSKEKKTNGFSDKVVKLYKRVIHKLPEFQIDAAKDLDYSVCYPRPNFDRQSMMWDLNYFKYYFLKLANISFDEQELENDYKTFVDFLLAAPCEFFLYRDFQSRNIMIKNNDVWFIDYQGGRKGALQYDLASLLYDAKAELPNKIRLELFNCYIDNISEKIKFDRNKFKQHYDGYALIRIMQALGAYGFRGFYERKEHFLKSVPYALQNMENLLEKVKLPIKIPTLYKVWDALVRSDILRQFGSAKLRLTLRIQSFSFKRGIPFDEKGHGGGFVFDCRFLPNPGRFEQYKALTGNDETVIDFLDKKPEAHTFFDHVKSIVENAANNYRQRNFTDLYVAFGCTGGQHRSVYFARKLASFFKDHYDIDVDLRHREQELKK